jgi:hypothetical protein
MVLNLVRTEGNQQANFCVSNDTTMRNVYYIFIILLHCVSMTTLHVSSGFIKLRRFLTEPAERGLEARGLRYMQNYQFIMFLLLWNLLYYSEKNIDYSLEGNEMINISGRRSNDLNVVCRILRDKEHSGTYRWDYDWLDTHIWWRNKVFVPHFDGNPIWGKTAFSQNEEENSE